MFRGNTVLGRPSIGVPLKSERSVSPVVPVRGLQNDQRRIDQILFSVFLLMGYVLEDIGNTTIEEIWWIGAFVFALSAIRAKRERVVDLLRQTWPLVLFLALAILSTAWSSDHGTTLKRSFALAGSGVISLWIATRLNLRFIVDTLGIITVTLGIISMLLIIFVPSIGVSDIGWQGCFAHKNGLGQFALLGFITVCCGQSDSKGFHRAARFGSLALFVILLVGSKSGTSIFIAGVLAIFFPLMLWSRKNLFGKTFQLVALLTLTLTVVTVASTMGKETILGALGKDDTLTTRTDVWQLVTDSISEQPLLGYGYKVYWLSHGEQGSVTGKDTLTWVTQAHNGYLEDALDLGYVGLTLVCILLGIAIWRSVILFWFKKDLVSAWPLLFITVLVLTNITEATIATYYNVTWVLFMASFFIVTPVGDWNRRQLNVSP